MNSCLSPWLSVMLFSTTGENMFKKAGLGGRMNCIPIWCSCSLWTTHSVFLRFRFLPYEVGTVMPSSSATFFLSSNLKWGKSFQTLESLEELVKTHNWAQHQGFWLNKSGWGLRICTSNQYPDDCGGPRPHLNSTWHAENTRWVGAVHILEQE
jgi:hypothetical protein